MKPYPLTILIVLVLIGLSLPANSFAETLYVKKSGTKLRASDSSKSETLNKLDKGTPVNVLKKAGKFYQVAAPGNKKGWIFKFKLTAKAPEASQGGSLLDALGGQKMAAKESASGSSIRGLSPISEKHAKSKGIPEESIQAVKQMETFKVGQDEVDAFLEQGKLGEYGS